MRIKSVDFEHLDRDLLHLGVLGHCVLHVASIGVLHTLIPDLGPDLVDAVFAVGFAVHFELYNEIVIKEMSTSYERRGGQSELRDLEKKQLDHLSKYQ